MSSILRFFYLRSFQVSKRTKPAQNAKNANFHVNILSTFCKMIETSTENWTEWSLVLQEIAADLHFLTLVWALGSIKTKNKIGAQTQNFSKILNHTSRRKIWLSFTIILRVCGSKYRWFNIVAWWKTSTS